MEKLLAKLGMGARMRKNFAAILFVAAGGAIIYGLPYFRYDYYDAYMEVYNLTNTQIGVFGSIFGVFGMISYLFGGYVADICSTRKLLSFSLIGTGLGGFLHLLPLNFTQLLALYAFWGFTSLFAFWPACVKAVRILSDSSDQGKAFGFFEGGRGVAATLMATFSVVAFRMGIKSINDEAMGMRYLIVYYSVLTIAVGLLVFWKMKDGEDEKSEKITFKDIGTVLKMPAVWIIGIVTFCNYVFCLSVYYFIPYSTSMLGLSVTLGATLAAFRRYLTPVSNVGGGYIGDKIGTGNLLLVSFLVMAGGTGLILALPLNNSMIWVFVGAYLTIYFFFNVNYALTWAMMEEGRIPDQFSGTAAGIISTVGYLPEIFCSLLAGHLLDTYEGATGYRYFFGFLIVMLLLGAVFVMLWKKYLAKHGLGKKNEMKENAI